MGARTATIGAAVILLVAGAAWLVGLFGGVDPAVAELEAMRDQMFDRDLGDAERQQLREQFRQRLDGLSEDQRRALFAAGRQQWMQRAERRMDEFFAISPAEQRQRLDDMINRMLNRGDGRGRNPAGRRDARGGERGGRGRNMSAAEREAWAKQRLDRSTPKQRAQRDEFRRRLVQRMAERGIPADKLPGRRGWRRSA